MSPFLYPPTDIRQPVVIYEDGGGLVDSYIEQAHRYRSENRQVEIRGSCRSACLMALSVPNVCVGPEGVVQAHHAFEQYSKRTRADITDRMLAELPAPIQNRLAGKIQVHYSKDATLTYSDLRQLGVPACSNKNVAARNYSINPIGMLFRTLGIFR